MQNTTLLDTIKSIPSNYFQDIYAPIIVTVVSGLIVYLAIKLYMFNSTKKLKLKNSENTLSLMIGQLEEYNFTLIEILENNLRMLETIEFGRKPIRKQIVINTSYLDTLIIEYNKYQITKHLIKRLNSCNNYLSELENVYRRFSKEFSNDVNNKEKMKYNIIELNEKIKSLSQILNSTIKAIKMELNL